KLRREVGIDLCVDTAGTDGVAADSKPVLCAVDGHRAGVGGHRSLRRAVTGIEIQPGMGGYRCDIDDASRGLFGHDRQRMLAAEHCSLDVHCAHVSPLVQVEIDRVGDVYHTGVVDQYIQATVVPDQ